MCYSRKLYYYRCLESVANGKHFFWENIKCKNARIVGGKWCPPLQYTSPKWAEVDPLYGAEEVLCPLCQRTTDFVGVGPLPLIYTYPPRPRA